MLTIFLFALIGTALGELATLIIPETWKFHEILATSMTPVWSIDKLDIIILAVNFCISFKFNIVTLAGIIAGCIFSLRKV